MERMLTNATIIENFVFDVKHSIGKKYGTDTMEREIYPLTWYIYTGRASTLFLKKLLVQKPYVIGNILHKGGSVEEVLKRIKKKIGYKETVI